MAVSESPSSSDSALLCTSESLSLFFGFLFHIFIQCPFLYHCLIFTNSDQKENIQIIRPILDDKSRE